MICKILAAGGGIITISVSDEYVSELEQKGVKHLDISPSDGTFISAPQRRHIFATIRDISDWSGNEPDNIRQLMQYDFCINTDRDWFSLSNTDKATARAFLTYLINFCISNGIPTKQALFERTDDIDAYLYACLINKKCALCGKEGAQLHHYNAIGMGRDRKEICHIGMEAISLCPEHHSVVEQQGKSYLTDRKLYGIKIDDKIAKAYRLRGDNK